METYKLVLPEHLNHYGFLFGGNLLKWIDEVSYITVSLDYPGCNFVTVGMDKVEFKKSIRGGSILCFVTEKAKTGKTSVEYTVHVYKKSIATGERILAFSTHITFVCLAACRTNDKETGHKQVLGLSFYVHFSSRKPYQAHSTPNKPQLAALYS